MAIKTVDGKLDIDSVYRSYRDAKDATKSWREEAQECYAYLAGDQYSDEDKAALELEKRPSIEFNQYAIYIETVCGLETLQREEVSYSARVPGQPLGIASDILNAAAKYVSDDSGAPMHQSMAFKDMVTCGMGWTDTRMDYETNPDGDVIAAERLDPVDEMYWDPRATKQNIVDTQWRLRIMPMSREDVEDRWPDKAGKIVWDKRFEPPYDWGVSHEGRPQEKYDMVGQGPADVGETEDAEVYVGHLQWHETEPYYRVASPDGQSFEADKKGWESLKKEDPELTQSFEVVSMKRRVFKQAFIVGGTVLEEGPNACPDGFTFQCMTGKYDRNNNVWFGLGRSLKSPQMWVNKMFSAFIATIAYNSKGGGVMVEADSHPNIRELEDNWARPDYIPVFRPGALATGKVIPKPAPPYPQSIDRLMEIAMGMFQHVSGVNPELLGLVSREQAGVLEYQRKQASMTTLSWAFDAIRKYREEHGRVLAYFIKTYISDGRLVKVAGPDKAQYVQLTRDVALMEHDIDVDTAPSSPNEKDRVFAIIRELLPMLAPFGITPPPEALDYLPLPTTFIEAWKERMAKPDPMTEQAKQLTLQKQEADIRKTEAAAMLDQVKAQSESVKGQIEASKLELEKIRLGHETQMMQQKAWFEQISATQKQQAAEMQMRLQEQKMVADQQKSMMEIIKSDVEQRQMQEQFMMSQADKQAQARLAIESKLSDMEMKRQASMQELQSSQLSEFQRMVMDFTKVMREEIKKSKENPESTEIDNPNISLEILDTFREVADELSELKGKVLGMEEAEETPQEIVYDETGRVASVGNRKLVRDEDGMVIRVE